MVPAMQGDSPGWRREAGLRVEDQWVSEWGMQSCNSVWDCFYLFGLNCVISNLSLAVHIKAGNSLHFSSICVWRQCGQFIQQICLRTLLFARGRSHHCSSWIILTWWFLLLYSISLSCYSFGQIFLFIYEVLCSILSSCYTFPIQSDGGVSQSLGRSLEIARSV